MIETAGEDTIGKSGATDAGNGTMSALSAGTVIGSIESRRTSLIHLPSPRTARTPSMGRVNTVVPQPGLTGRRGAQLDAVGRSAVGASGIIQRAPARGVEPRSAQHPLPAIAPGADGCTACG